MDDGSTIRDTSSAQGDEDKDDRQRRASGCEIAAREHTGEYPSYLKSLDDSQLISHINSLSQDRHSPLAVPRSSVKGTSTPLPPNKKFVESFKSTSTDPFDDGLDEVIADLASKNTAPVGLDSESSSEDESFGHVGPLHDFGDYGTYFQNKSRKQQQSDQAFVKWDDERRKLQHDTSPRKKIFDGCTIFVNGHTNPSMSEIHRLVILHGGVFLSFLHNKGAATHIVCDRLTPRKRIAFRNYKVVKAKWITDCIAKNQLLNWFDYRLIDDVDYGQKRLGFDKVDEADLDNDDQMIAEQTIAEQTIADQITNSDVNQSTKNQQDEDDVDDVEELENDLPLTQPESEAEEEKQKSQSRIEFFENLNQLRDVKDPNIILDAKHPKFLQHFFANSRLHHLSTWKTDLRTRFLRRIVDSSKSSVSTLLKTQLHEKVIMHVDFDCFFATASCLNHPNLDINKDPIAVTHGGRTSDVASCNYIARNHGISNGMWLSRAQRLCPNLITIDYDFDSYEKFSNLFYNYLISSGKFDSIFPVSIDEALLDATSYCLSNSTESHTLVDSVYDLINEIRSKIYQLTNCSVSIGASKNVLLAKLAIRKAKPNGQFYLHDKVHEFLKSVPVKNLPGIGHSIKEKIMNELKNSSKSEPLVQDLLTFSKQKLMHIFGDKTGTKLFNYARGKDDTSIKIDLDNSESVLGRKSVSVDVNFGIRFDTVTQLETFLIDLSKELYSRLVGLGICGSSLTLRLAKRADNAPVEPEKYLGMGVCDYFNKTSRLGVPTNDWGIIGNELKALYRMLNIPVKELRGIAVTMSKLKDVAMLKKDRQMRLPFSAIGKNDDMDIGKNNDMNISNVVEASPIKAVKHISSTIQAQPATHSIDRLTYDTIDWEVFKEIPEDIKRELKRELSRRGMQNSPIKKSPVKREAANSKVFLQQLLPTQDNGSVKYARVVHPSKSPTKKRKVSKSPSPIKKESSPVKYVTDLSTSYDESVLNELPSSVKAEVLKDLQYKRKVKRMNLALTRESIKNEELTVTNKITQSWVNQQTVFLQPPLFLNQQFSYNEIVAKIKGWIQMTFNQQGPHADDIGFFRNYLAELLYQHNLNRCLNLMNVLQTELDCHSRVISMNKHFTPEEREFKTACINDWKAYLANDLKNVILQYCIKNSIEIDI